MASFDPIASKNPDSKPILTWMRKNQARNREPRQDDERSLGIKILLAPLLFALFVSPIGHGCSISHRHKEDDEDDEPFRMLVHQPHVSNEPADRLAD